MWWLEGTLAHLKPLSVPPCDNPKEEQPKGKTTAHGEEDPQVESHRKKHEGVVHNDDDEAKHSAAKVARDLSRLQMHELLIRNR